MGDDHACLYGQMTGMDLVPSICSMVMEHRCSFYLRLASHFPLFNNSHPEEIVSFCKAILQSFTGVHPIVHHCRISFFQDRIIAESRCDVKIYTVQNTAKY
jgi:hypothetical protein